VNVRFYRSDHEGDSADQEADRVIADVRLVVVRGAFVEITTRGVSTAEEIDADEFTVCVIP
jgi:hypothetical protein